MRMPRCLAEDILQPFTIWAGDNQALGPSGRKTLPHGLRIAQPDAPVFNCRVMQRLANAVCIDDCEAPSLASP